MRQKLVLLAVVCLIALPLAAASSSPAPAVETAPTPQPALAGATAPQPAVAPTGCLDAPLPTSVIDDLAPLYRGCINDDDCKVLCPGFGICQPGGYCLCIE